jgi:SAM-dependent methyltransferase
MTDESRWTSATGGGQGREYAARFASLAASGTDIHGEATLCTSLVPIGARVLDAGCGTGRVAIRLAELGYTCVGVDSDPSMLEEARAASADVTWLLRDLAALDDGVGTFDLVVAAGNVIPLLAPGTEPGVVALLAGRLRLGGALVAGFGLDAAHLPLPAAPFGLSEYDSWCAASGLGLDQRFSTWDAVAYTGGGYAVSIHRPREPVDDPEPDEDHR